MDQHAAPLLFLVRVLGTSWNKGAWRVCWWRRTTQQKQTRGNGAPALLAWFLATQDLRPAGFEMAANALWIL
jgi:hypothetical protein